MSNATAVVISLRGHSLWLWFHAVAWNNDFFVDWLHYYWYTDIPSLPCHDNTIKCTRVDCDRTHLHCSCSTKVPQPLRKILKDQRKAVGPSKIWHNVILTLSGRANWEINDRRGVYSTPSWPHVSWEILDQSFWNFAQLLFRPIWGTSVNFRSGMSGIIIFPEQKLARKSVSLYF